MTEEHPLKTGFGFGLTSGIITTLGLIVGLHSGTHSRLVIIGAILVIAIADALSDAMGIHIHEEMENRHPAKEVWQTTISTFISKFVFALTFIIPVLLFPLTIAIIVCIIWGLSLLTVLSIYMAKQQGTKAHRVVLEHLVIAILVIVMTHYTGDWIASFV